MKDYIWNLLVSVDQLVNTIFAGNPDESISSRAAKAERAGKKWGCVLCKLLDKIDKDHCNKNIELDEGNK